MISRHDGTEHSYANRDRAGEAAAYERSFGEDFSLPKDHRVTQDLRVRFFTVFHCFFIVFHCFSLCFTVYFTCFQAGFDPVSTETPLGEGNRGFKLLQKMGWKENTPLGRPGSDGLLEPVTMKFRTAGDTIGIGKDTEYTEMSETAAVERRKYLEVEMDLTEDEKAARLVKHGTTRVTFGVTFLM